MEDFTAKTRDGEIAHFRRLPPGYEVDNGYQQAPFILLGYINHGEPELWTGTGSWSDTGAKHAHDLILTK